MTPFKTNLIKYELNRKAIAEKYDVFQIQKDGERFNHGSMILDVPLVEKRVCAVRFESRNVFHVLMEKGDGNRELLWNALKQSDEINKICIPPICLSDVDDRTLLQLLINSLGTSSNPILGINNLTGHLYCYRPAWQRIRKIDGVIEQVSCLEVVVTKDMKLTLPVKTFTSCSCKDKIRFTKKRPYEFYPKYVLSRFQTMARKTKENIAEEFIQRQIYNCKFNIDFLKITKEKEDFENSKMGVLNEIITRFNFKFKNLAKIDFESISEYISVNRNRVQINEDESLRKEVLHGKKFRIIDLVRDDKSGDFCKKMQSVFASIASTTPSIGNNKIKDGLNICVVYEKDKYVNEDDAYGSINGCPVQHVTIGGEFKNKKAQIDSVINELLIKHDIEQQHFSLYNWTDAGFENDISFGLRFKQNDDEEREIYCFITVHPDGTFVFSKKDPTDIFDFNIYSQCVQIFASSDDICGIVINHEEKINIIRDTDWITIPEIEEIKNEYNLDRTHEFRSAVGRENYLTACTDIKMFDNDGLTYYFVGTIGLGMQASIPNAVNIRKIEPYGDAPLFFEKLLPLMNTTFVRNQRMTVIPFPFKYLREWAKMNKFV